MTSQNFTSSRVQHFRELWAQHRELASIEQLDRVCSAFVTEALGVEEEIAERFFNDPNDMAAAAAIGKKQSAVHSTPETLLAFWEAVGRIFPDDYGDDDFDYLANVGCTLAMLEFLHDIDPVGRTRSPAMAVLNTNAHAWR